MPTIGITNSGADVAKFLPHSPVPITASNEFEVPYSVMSVLLLAPDAVRNMPDFLA